MAELFRNWRSFMPLLVETAVGVTLLLVIWLIMSVLPMTAALDLPLAFSLSQLLSALIVTGIVAVLINFSIRLDLRARHLGSEYVRIAALVKQSVFMFAVLMIYFAYWPLIVPYSGRLEWIYHLVFLGAFGAVLAVVAYTLYQSSDWLMSLLQSTGLLGQTTVLTCDCGKGEREGTRFCSMCGTELTPAPECSACGRLVPPGAAFCSNCGAASEAAPPGDATPGDARDAGGA